MTTWRKELTNAAKENGESLKDLTIAIDEGELDREFHEGYGRIEGAPFTAWSSNYVYFPIRYDGSEWVGSAPRNPNGQKTFHQGG